MAIPFLQKKKKEPEKPKQFSEMTVGERLLKYDFYATDAKGIPIVTKDGKKTPDQESAEIYQHKTVETEWPAPLARRRLVLEYPEMNIEQMYFWFVRHFQEQWGCDHVIKIIDSYAASVSSSMFGNVQTRLAAQQNQASQFLKGISEMIKGLFQIVREVRIIEDRLSYYDKSNGEGQTALSSEIVLKSLWIDQVEGGAKNPGSVYGLANTVGFSILPDVFFRIKVKNRNSIEEAVRATRFNEKVKEVLMRKLRQYYEWKERTEKELVQRRSFEIKYLRQHYDTIQLYLSWIKPYLKNIRRLQMSGKNMGDINLIAAFESQIIEIETLFVRSHAGSKYKSVINAHFFYRVKPELSIHTYEYQHKGPINVGQVDMTLRAYAWNDAAIKNYQKYRSEDDLALLGSIDTSIQAALDSLGNELRTYLQKAGEDIELFEEKKSPGPDQLPGVLDPFLSVFKGFGDIAKSALPTGLPGKKKKEKFKPPEHKDLKAMAAAAEFSVEAIRVGYQKYKEGPGDCIYFIND